MSSVLEMFKAKQKQQALDMIEEKRKALLEMSDKLNSDQQDKLVDLLTKAITKIDEEEIHRLIPIVERTLIKNATEPSDDLAEEESWRTTAWTVADGHAPVPRNIGPPRFTKKYDAASMSWTVDVEPEPMPEEGKAMLGAMKAVSAMLDDPATCRIRNVKLRGDRL